MAGINLPSIPRISDADLDDAKERRRIMNYLFKLDEQLRYMMTHLGEENLGTELVKAIDSKASAQQVNEVTGNIERVSTRIEQTEREISMKADQEELDALGQTVSSHSTLIEQNASAIALKASQSSVDSLTGRVSSAETSLTLKADQATLTSTANNLQSQIDAVPGKITLAISDVNIGGRNYVKNSEAMTREAYTSGWTHIVVCEGLPAGKSMVLSIDSIVQNSGTTPDYLDVTVFNGNANPSIGHLHVSASRQSIAFTVPSDGTTYNLLIYCGVQGSANNKSFTFNHVMLEEGNKATAWSPSPEDPASGVVNNSITIDTEGIKMSSSDVFQLVATNNSKQSFIDILGLFTVDKTGSLTAASGSYDSLTVGGQRVLTLSDIGIPIKVATSQPTGNNFIWLQPTGGGSVSSVRYTGYTAPSRNDSVNFGINNPISRSFTSEDGVSTLSGSTYTYELEFEIYSLSSFTGVAFSATATKGGSTVTFDASSAITLNKYNHPVIKLTKSGSSINLASNTSAITVEITATASPGRDGLFLQSQQNMTLTISTTSSGSGVQTCNVKYVP